MVTEMELNLINYVLVKPIVEF